MDTIGRVNLYTGQGLLPIRIGRGVKKCINFTGLTETSSKVRWSMDPDTSKLEGGAGGGRKRGREREGERERRERERQRERASERASEREREREREG